MALTIKENNGVFLVEGSINASTAMSFRNHCETLLETLGELTINIENVSFIDVNGLATLRALYEKTLHTDKRFYIVGTGCKEIYDEFRLSITAA